MPTARALPLVFAFVLAFAPVRPAAADQIAITSGFLNISGAQDIMSRGFLRSIAYEIGTETFTLSWNDSDGLRQDPFAPVLPNVALWTPTGGTTDTVFINTPRFVVNTFDGRFTMSTHLEVYNMATGATLFSDPIHGWGTVQLQVAPGLAGDLVVSGARYEFEGIQPTPEPATLLLLGSGLAGVALLRRRSAG